MPMPAETSQVSVPTFTDDWATAGEAMSAANAAAAVKHATLRIVIMSPFCARQASVIDAE